MPVPDVNDAFVAVVIVAAGRGRRLGGEIPKQYIPLGHKTALRRVAELFLAHPSVGWVVPVIHADDRGLYADAMAGLADPGLMAPVEGADTRARSVRNGLESLAPHAPQKVLIHDAARPFLPPEVIDRVLAALQTSEGACAALPVVDALWQAEDGAAHLPVPRDGLWRAQTPQGFDFERILQAHLAHDGSGADDVAVACEFGLRVALVPGAEAAYKITTAPDLARARADAALLDATVQHDG